MQRQRADGEVDDRVGRRYWWFVLEISGGWLSWKISYDDDDVVDIIGDLGDDGKEEQLFFLKKSDCNDEGDECDDDDDEVDDGDERRDDDGKRSKVGEVSVQRQESVKHSEVDDEGWQLILFKREWLQR